MKDRAERFVVLPFSIGCTSDTSVALATTSQPPKKPKPESNPPATSMIYISLSLSLSLSLLHFCLFVCFRLEESFCSI